VGCGWTSSRSIGAATSQPELTTRGQATSDEVDAVEWIDPAAPLPSPTTPELGEVLARAAQIEAEHG
jgi:hypothetical protein